MKKIIALCALSVLSLAANAKDIPRTQVKGVDLHLEADGVTEVVNMNYCAGNYKGVAAIIWDDYMYNILKRSVCSESAKDCMQLEEIWNTKANPEDPRLPAFLLVYNPEKASPALINKAFRGQVSSMQETTKGKKLVKTEQLIDHEKGEYASSRVMQTKTGLIIASTCGGATGNMPHPPAQ